ncbi:MAG: hypothetical protein LUI87_02325 [Lachnospiraceae bacterium]|nr:hypothetical protein [Lachnospiraceae bacterium]
MSSALNKKSQKSSILSDMKVGEAQIYLAHIGMDDYPALKNKREAFNLIVRYCGGIPQNPPMPGMCATLAFTTKLFREDFAREIRDKLGVTAGIDFRIVYINRRYLPPQHNVDHQMDKYDFARLAEKAKYEKEIRRALHPEELEPEYLYPEGHLVQ